MYQRIHPFKLYYSVVLSIFTELYNLYHYLIKEHFHHPKKKLHPNSHFSVPVPTPRSLVTTSLLSVSADLPVWACISFTT